MEIPRELRRMPPASTLAWIAGHYGPQARVTGIRRLPNAWAAAVHAIDVDVDDSPGAHHELVLRRWARTDLPPDPGVVQNEQAALQLVGSAPGVVAPAFVVADASGLVADVPALVMTRLRGRDELAPSDIDVFLDGLVRVLRAIHAVSVPAGVLGEYQPWGLDGLTDAPQWSRRPDVWRRAIAIAQRPVPAYTSVLCHRDFHPGNVLWHGGRVSGVVDWTHTCRGPVAADVAHCRANLALLFGLDIADEFARRYGPLDDLAWFDIVDVAGWSQIDAWRWQDAGRVDITHDSIVDAFDGFVAAALERLS